MLFELFGGVVVPSPLLVFAFLAEGEAGNVGSMERGGGGETDSAVDTAGLAPVMTGGAATTVGLLSIIDEATPISSRFITTDSDTLITPVQSTHFVDLL